MRLVDTMNRAYHAEYGCMFTSGIPTNVYGKHDNFNIQDGHVIPGLMHKCYQAKKTGADFHFWGSGTPLRQFIYSLDLAELMVWTLRLYESVEPIVLSVDESAEVSIADVARKIAAAFKFGDGPGKVVFVELKDVVGPCFVMNCGQNTWIKMSTGRTLPGQGLYPAFFCRDTWTSYTKPGGTNYNLLGRGL